MARAFHVARPKEAQDKPSIWQLTTLHVPITLESRKDKNSSFSSPLSVSYASYMMADGEENHRNTAEENRDTTDGHGRNMDPGRKYGISSGRNNNAWKCNFCYTVTTGGVTRQKQHLVGGFRNAKKCTMVPDYVVKELQNYMIKKAENKAARDMGYEPEVGDEYDEGDMEVPPARWVDTKKQKIRGPLDKYISVPPADILHARKDRKGIFGACDKEQRNKVCLGIARWFYDAGIPFNAVNYPSYKEAIEMIGLYGVGLKPPTMWELREPLLKQEKENVGAKILENKTEWSARGFSLMSDGWHDPVSKKDIVNFLVNSPKGSVFLKSVDVSEVVKDSTLLFQMLDNMVEEVGEHNVVQVVTDNASNYIKARKLLMAERQNLYWTPCAAHCIDLMLEDIESIRAVRDAMKKCIFMNSYIYGRVPLVNMMRRYTGNRNLHRPAITRFATSFITMSQFHKQKKNLRTLITSTEWDESKWPKDCGARKVKQYILQESFWSNILLALKLASPLVKVLRMVDGEKKPAMGYIYAAMDRAKDAIAESFNNREEKYKATFEIIDKRWECQLHHPLHAAGYFLNPAIHYKYPEDVRCEEVEKGLYDCIERLIPEANIQSLIMNELDLFKNAAGVFGHNLAVKQREEKAPAEWWSCYGSSAPNLRNFAVKILSLTCSATGCERNWSVFQHLHTKRRNRLTKKRLNDMVYVKYNRALQRRAQLQDSYDPIRLKDIDESNEWLTGIMDGDSSHDDNDYVFSDDDLQWKDVSQAMGVEEPSYPTRKATSLGARDKGFGTSKSVRGNSSIRGNNRFVIPRRRRPSSRWTLVDEEESEDAENVDEVNAMEAEEDDDDLRYESNEDFNGTEADQDFDALF